MDVVEDVESEAAGSFSIRIHSPRVDDFESYYFGLNPQNHTRNPVNFDFDKYLFRINYETPKFSGFPSFGSKNSSA
jgi:hypothetical protein